MWNRKLSKLGQEEMVGFVLIVILVAIIGLVFLGIILRQPSEISYQESQEISSFLKSLRQYTTDCQKFEENYVILEDLIKMCDQGEKCLDDRISCDILEQEVQAIMDKSFVVGQEAYKKAYNMTIYYGKSGEPEKIYLNLQKGSFSTITVKKSEDFVSYGESDGTADIRLRLEVYYTD